jgi:hypothetical protein
MINRVRLSIGGIAAWLVVSLAVALWPTKQPFDDWYDEADPAQADWRLIVDYSVAGWKDKQQYVAHYCRRAQPRFQQGSWTFGDETTVWSEDFSFGMNNMYLASYGCGPAGGDRQSTIILPESTPEGVRLAMDFEHDIGNQSIQSSAIINIPFRTQVSGQRGNISYKAMWQRMPVEN